MSASPQEIPARSGRALPLPKDHTIRVTNTHGTQVVDFWAFTLTNSALTTFLSLPHTRASTLHFSPQLNDILISNLRGPLLQLTADTSPHVHDTLIAACDPQRYRLLGIPDDEGHASCAGNLRDALKAIGIEWPRGTLLEDWTPAPLNLWMNIPVGEGGKLSFQPPVSGKGDFVELKSLVDGVVVVMSCCPQDRVPINGVGMVPMGAAFEVLAP